MSGTVAERRDARTSYLGRLLDVVQVVSEAGASPLRLSEIANQTQLPVSTASRLLNLLASRDFVRRVPPGGYVAGSRLIHIASRILDQLGDARRFDEAVTTLGLEVGESSSVGIVVGDEIMLVARHDAEHSLRVVARVGDIVTPDLTAIGKAILAYSSRERAVPLLGRSWQKQASRALAKLNDELEEIRTLGYAVDDGASAEGLRCRAAPLLNHENEAVGAISIAGPSARFTADRADAAIPVLLREATRLSLTMNAESPV